MEQSGVNRKDFDLKACCDNDPDNTFGEKGSELRQLVQYRFNNIKQKKIKDYIKYLRKLSVTPGIETISEQLEAATEATTAVPSSKNKTPKKKAAKKTGATKKMSTKKTEDTSEDETWELGNDEEEEEETEYDEGEKLDPDELDALYKLEMAAEAAAAISSKKPSAIAKKLKASMLFKSPDVKKVA